MTAPPAAVTCEAWVNGNRLADTADAYHESTPTALAGLNVTWGRDNNLDQPATSACTLTVADVGDDTDYLRALHVGDVLEVYAAGRVHAAGDPFDVAIDGSFETADPGDRVDGTDVDVVADTSHVTTGARNLLATGTGHAGGSVAIPPAPFAAASTASEWATIPTVSPGETWTLDLTITPGIRQRVAVSGALFANPADRRHRRAGPFEFLGPGDLTTHTVSLAWTVTAADGPGYPGMLLSISYQSWAGTPGTWTSQPGSWSEWGSTWFDEMVILAPPTAIRRVLVFTGRITDLEASWAGNTRCAITASDWTVELSNDQLTSGWVAQPITARVAAIRGLAGVSFDADIDTHPGGLEVTWLDVGTQPVMGLLTDLAVTADAVLWPAFSATRGFYLWMEDPGSRGSFGTLVFDDGVSLVVIAATRPSTAVTMSACDFAADGVSWTQDVTDVISRVTATWQEQTVDGGGLPTTPVEHVIRVSDADRVTAVGLRNLDWSTQLTSAADATEVASRVLTRSDDLDWHATGLRWDTRIPVEFTDPIRAVLLDLLDGTRRIGMPLVVTDMPGWTPAGDTIAVFVEGGQYSYTGGRWQLALNISPAPHAGASVLWFDLDPAWQWQDFDPAITWQQLWGITSTTASPRWNTLDGHAWTDDPNTWTDYIS